MKEIKKITKTFSKTTEIKHGLIEKKPFYLEKFPLTLSQNASYDMNLVRAKTLYFAICGSDYIHSTSSPFKSRFIGHEWIGTMPNGEFITTEVFWGCGKCSWCKKGMDRCCHFKKVFSLGDAGGASLLNVNIPLRNLTKINTSLFLKFPLWLLTMLEPITVSYSIVEDLKNLTSGFDKHGNILIIGGGFTGLVMGYFFKKIGIHVKFKEKQKKRESNLVKLGFEIAGKKDAEFDIIIDAAGERPISGNSAFQDAVNMVRRCGIVVGSGKYIHPPKVEVKELQDHGLTIMWPRGGKEKTLEMLAIRPPIILFELLNFLNKNSKTIFKKIKFFQLPSYYTKDNQISDTLRTIVKVGE